MAKRKNPDSCCVLSCNEHKKQAYCIFGLFLSVLGLAWIAYEVGWSHVNLPYGPLVTVAIGFAVILSTLPKAE